MAKIYNFPDGELIEDTGNPNLAINKMLDFVKNSPEDAAAQLTELSYKFNHVVNTVLSVHKFCKEMKSAECQKVVNMIELQLNMNKEEQPVTE